MSILGTPVNFAATPTQALTWSLETGTTAVIIVICHEQTALTELVDAVSMGSVSATFFGSNTAGGSGSARPIVEVWRITADLNSIGANPTLTITPDAAATGDYYGTIFCIDGVDTNPANWTDEEDADTCANALQITCTTATDSIVIGGASCTVYGNAFTTTVGGADVEVASSDRNISTLSRVVSFSRVATGSTVVVDCDNGSTSGSAYQAMYAVSIPAGGTPTISGTSDDTPTNGSTLTISGSNFGTSQGAGGVTANGSGWTETSWGNSSIAVTVALGNNRYNANVSLVVTDNSAQSSSGHNVQIQPASGVAYFNLSGTPAASGLLEAIPELTGTEQIEVSGVVGGSVSGITINADGTLVIDGDITLWYARAHNGTEWGRLAAIDMTPDTTAPTLTSATIGTNGNSLTLVFSESVNIGAGGGGGVSINAAGGSATGTYASGDGTGTLVYTLSRTVSDTETWADVDYVQPGNGIEDDSGNDLASFFDVPVTNNSTQNAAPTDISLSISSIAEDAGTNTVVGQLSATDPDYGDTHTFALVSGTGSTNNASFSISGTSLICPDPATLGDGTYSIRVRATDSAANTYDKVFSIIVTAAAVVLERINFVDSHTGTNSTSDITCQVGDLLVAWCSRDGSVTTPTMPEGWESTVAGGASSLGYRLAWKVATSTTETSGTWTNATSIAINQYRPGAGYTLSIGSYSSGVNSSGTNALYPALTLTDTSGYSWVQCNYAHRSADIAASDATAAGLTVRAFVQDATDTLAVHTAAKVATFPATTVTYTGTSGSRRYVAVEIKAVSTAGGTSTKTTLRSFVRTVVRSILKR